MSSKNSKEFSFHKSEGAWEYFLRERLGQCAQCKLCKAVIKTVGGSTKGLHVHLETKHSINVRKRASPAGKNDDSTENKIFDIMSACQFGHAWFSVYARSLVPLFSM